MAKLTEKAKAKLLEDTSKKKKTPAKPQADQHSYMGANEQEVESVAAPASNASKPTNTTDKASEETKIDRSDELTPG